MPIGSMPSVTTAPGTSFDVAEEFLEPALEVHAVPQHEVGGLRLHDVERRRLVVVDLRARLGDGFHDRRVAGDFARMSAMTVKVVTTCFFPEASGFFASATADGQYGRHAVRMSRFAKTDISCGFRGQEVHVCFNVKF